MLIIIYKDNFSRDELGRLALGQELVTYLAGKNWNWLRQLKGWSGCRKVPIFIEFIEILALRISGMSHFMY